MTRVLAAPGKYKQGPGIIENLGEHLGDDLGSQILVIGDPVILDMFGDRIKTGLADKEVNVIEFAGECSHQEINRIQKTAEEKESELVLGIGGGKTLDTAKAVAYKEDLPVGVVPTIAATDAPCSALSVIYTEEGVFEEYLFLPTNPDFVLVDTKVVAEAPVEFLVAGMGDALATYFEADACAVTKAETIAGGTQTEAALELARLCYATLLEYGAAAKKAVAAGVVTEAVEKIVEANTLLSGLGFESGGLAAAHAIHNGLTVIDATHEKTHGEKVAFATLVQLVLTDREPQFVDEVIEFAQTVGLPTTLADLGVEEPTEEEIAEVAKAACSEDETIHNLPFPVTPEMVKNAILAADKLGQ